jgi:hypothetical protein
MTDDTKSDHLEFLDYLDVPSEDRGLDPPPLVRSDERPLTYNENWDPAFESSLSTCVDFFSKACGAKLLKDISLTSYDAELAKMWAEDPLTTLRLIFYKRDCRGGQGEKRLFHVCIDWLRRNHPTVFEKNLRHVPFYGSWKDLRLILNNSGQSDVRSCVALLFANQLDKDLTALRAYEESEETKGSTGFKPSISLAAKWLNHRDFRLYRMVAVAMGYAASHAEEMLRKRVLVPLRKYLDVVERKMAARQWGEIEYSHVPSQALQRYKKVFESHDPERFLKWKSNPKTKVNVATLYPYQVVQAYLGRNITEIDELVEKQWNEIVARTPKGSFLAISDTSSSMTGLPMEISVALGILLSRVSTSHPGRVVSFNTTPTMITLKGKSLYEDVKDMLNLDWGGSTDLDATFRLVLDESKKTGAAPETIVLFTDGQFDHQTMRYPHTSDDTKEHEWNATAFERVKNMYVLSGFKMPRLVFWNLRGDVKTLPVLKNEINTVMVSGFSMDILQYVLDKGCVTPEDVMRKVVSSERYARLTIDE